ncbi:lymphocyte expansion molecule [Rissa tridactyla]|uniref:lymphocyte expansion molecule n=1 Tax=Rissa tridactyla TaxID=75485 RepID=UPI0023BB092D|nr:lymphocyte expansion molecule [Rissa tridactyla]
MALQVLPRDMGSQGKASASGWARAEKGCHLPHFQSKEIMKRRKHQQERLGPGTYNIRDFLQETRPCSLRGICDTREQRFRDGRRDCFPGPGTYGPRGNPYAHLEERDKRSASRRGLMDSRTERCALPAALGSGLGPGTYHLRSSIDEGLRRVMGSRHCQPFSGDRSKPAGGGHHALEQRKGTELSTVAVKGFTDELMLRENKKKGCFSTLPRNPGCPTERIFWATLSQCPREAWAVGPGSYNPKPVEKSAYFSQPPFWSSAKRFDRKSYRLFTGNENVIFCCLKASFSSSSISSLQSQYRPGHVKALPGFAPVASLTLPLDGEAHETFSFQNPVGVGRYDITMHEKYPRKMRYQSLYQCDTQRYLSNLKRDAYLLKRLKPVAKNNWSDLISAPRCPDTSEDIAAVSQT